MQGREKQGHDQMPSDESSICRASSGWGSEPRGDRTSGGIVVVPPPGSDLCYRLVSDAVAGAAVR